MSGQPARVAEAGLESTVVLPLTTRVRRELGVVPEALREDVRAALRDFLDL